MPEGIAMRLVWHRTRSISPQHHRQWRSSRLPTGFRAWRAISSQCFALNMYCHWALHVDLHGKDTITPFLQQVDAYVDGVLVGPEDFGASNRMVRDFIFLDTFRSQLRDFFQTNGIRTELTDDDARWNQFVKHYAGVIEDGSLSIRAQNHGLKHVKQVTFVKGRDAIGEFAEIPFDMMWCVALLDGRNLDIDVNARPARDGAGQMIGWGVHLH